MTATTSLKLPEALKEQIAQTAAREGKTAHALMVDALQTAMNEASLMHAFHDSALAAYEETVRINKVYRGADIEAYYLAKMRGETAKKPPMVQWQPGRDVAATIPHRSRKRA
jgi:predicted transcriptional regulator